jgi:ubiquinone/menaquinone biosynthesis C-methylase UbiE/uncharacterized protein YbaR (Trm112 family)
MLIKELEALRCPNTRSGLRLVNPDLRGDIVMAGKLVSSEGREYPIDNGVPDFVGPSVLSAIESRTKAEYDRVADGIYDVAVDWQFAAMYEDEGAVRESMIDQLELKPSAAVLEVGCGTGRDSFRLARRLDRGGRLHMQDLSRGMVHACVEKMVEHQRTSSFDCSLEYSVANATSLPFSDDQFDAVFHFGGFNQFGDLTQAAAELTRVAKRGARIVIGDEAVAPWLRGTEFEAIVVTNNPLFKAEAPLAVLPVGARNVSVRWMIGNCFYLIAFTRGDGPPPLNLDLPHRGWRGGTMRSRYFGTLEGVTPEAKALAVKSAKQSGLSVHEWLDRLIKSQE